MDKYKKAAQMIKDSSHITAFTGAGISVESGVPPFRGKEGLWNKYDPAILDINRFYADPEKIWGYIKEIFYDYFAEAEANPAHKALAELENQDLIKAVITQNIDNLHQEAGSKNVIEFHGNSKKLVCTKCGNRYTVDESIFAVLPPKCDDCQGVLKPDFVFFGESIPDKALDLSYQEAEKADLFLVIGTTGEVYPASMIPIYAKDSGAEIIEINTKKSNFTDRITDIFLKDKASIAVQKIAEELDIS
ncbi:MAG: SIR2 family NAD-dependent protein deacylase [Halanaerobium sp.]